MASSTNTTGNDLDITRIPSENHEQLAIAIEGFYKQDGTQKTKLSYFWERVMRMVDGDQWLVWTNGAGGVYQWNTLQVQKANEYIPRPVTNYLFDSYQTLKAYLTKTRPTTTVRPNEQNYQSKASAKLAQLCLDANYERLKEQENYEYAASVFTMYGTVFKKSFWDPTLGPKIELPAEAPLDVEQALEQTQEGQPLVDSVPLGDINTCIKEPYCMAVDPLATGLHTARWIMEYAIQPLDWIREMYGRSGEGYTGLAETVTEETQLSGSLRRFYQLKNSSGIKNGSALEGVGNSDTGTQTIKGCAVVKEYYERPTQMNPKGRMVVVANGVCLYAGESNCEGPDEGDWHPYSEARWELVPARFFGKGPLDNACDIQKRVNSIDSTIMLVRKTQAIPQKLVPNGSGISSGEWTGRPGQTIFFNPEMGEPKTVPAAGVDAQVWREREQCVNDIKAVSGAIDILKGEREPGVNAASALALLYEVGTGKLFPVLERWKRMIECDQKKQLRLIAKHFKEPREEFIKLLKKYNKELPSDAISRFIGSDLMDNVDVITEAGSNVPKLESMKQMRLEQAASVGAVDISSPINRMEYQRQMGIVGFDNDVGPDSKRAEWENDCLDNLLINPDKKPVVMVFDNHEIHIQKHEDRMKQPSWMDMDPALQDAYMAHVEEHRMMAEQALQQQMVQAAAAGQMPEPQPTGTESTPTKAHGKGAPSAIREAAMKQDLPPGSEVA